MIRIDGSYGEGGGQILRTSIALSCITGEKVEVINIRANRPKPGLAPQHLKGIEAAKLISDAKVEGLKIGSTRILFEPKRIKGGHYKIDIGTAGSITLILQTILLPSLLARENTTFSITGGTDVAWSPPIDYFRNVTLRALREIGCDIEVILKKRGYYPKGGGKVEVTTRPSKLSGSKFTKIDNGIAGISHCQNLPKHVALRQAESAKKYLVEKGLDANIRYEVHQGPSTGSGITIWCGFKGGSSLGRRGKRAEEVGQKAASLFYKEFISDSAFDKHLADQILPFASIAKGSTIYSTSEITSHLQSNVYVIEKFFGKIVKIRDNTIKVQGVNI